MGIKNPKRIPKRIQKSSTERHTQTENPLLRNSQLRRQLKLKITYYIKMKVKENTIQLTLEQHRSELQGLTYTGIFSIQLVLCICGFCIHNQMWVENTVFSERETCRYGVLTYRWVLQSRLRNLSMCEFWYPPRNPRTNPLRIPRKDCI